jgi:hypothetical protein
MIAALSQFRRRVKSFLSFEIFVTAGELGSNAVISCRVPGSLAGLLTVVVALGCGAARGWRKCFLMRGRVYNPRP